MFESSCSNRSVHKNHRNVICAKRLFVEKRSYNCFLFKNHTLGNKIKIKIKTLTPVTNFFIAFLVKVLNTISSDQNKNINVL